jgi:putative pyruvate formate lyase activating enzyme
MAGETGFCGVGNLPFVASAGPHFGEEPPLVGRRGSGTIFFSGCNMGCIFCQNHDISHGREGDEISAEELSAMMLNLQSLGCHNINLVTPTHQMPMILQALASACEAGLRLPLVWNSGGYDGIEALRLLNGIVDIYMPDLKYMDEPTGLALSDAPGYPEAAKTALREMHRQVGDLVNDETGIALRGMIIRHLVLPEGLAGTEETMRFIAEELSTDSYVNVMDQYRPCFRADKDPRLMRRITPREYSDALGAAQRAGLHRLA